MLASWGWPIIRSFVRTATSAEDVLPADPASPTVHMPAHMHKHQRQRLEAQHNRQVSVGTEQRRQMDLDQYYASQRKRIQNDAIPLTPRLMLSNTSAWQRIVLLVSLIFLSWSVGTSALSCPMQPSTSVLPALNQV